MCLGNWLILYISWLLGYSSNIFCCIFNNGWLKFSYKQTFTLKSIFCPRRKDILPIILMALAFTRIFVNYGVQKGWLSYIPRSFSFHSIKLANLLHCIKQPTIHKKQTRLNNLNRHNDIYRHPYKLNRQKPIIIQLNL
jgi:hypothetical protein